MGAIVSVSVDHARSPTTDPFLAVARCREKKNLPPPYAPLRHGALPALRTASKQQGTPDHIDDRAAIVSFARVDVLIGNGCFKGNVHPLYCECLSLYDRIG